MTDQSPSVPGSRNPPATGSARRLVSPDLARGIMLLFICGANALTSWSAPENGAAMARSGVHGDGALNRAAVIFADLFLHVRGLPMFALLLGYGIGMIAMSLWRRGYPPARARRVLARRYALLALFGALHMVFLFHGDIMYAYGALGVVVALFLTLGNRTLLSVAAVLFVLNVALAVVVQAWVADGAADNAAKAPGGIFSASYSPENYGATILHGLVFLFSNTLSMALLAASVLPVVLLGFVAARLRVLSQVERYRTLLAWWCLPGLLVILLVGLPWALADVGILDPQLAPALASLNDGLGWLVGPSAVAAIALATEKLQRKVDRAREQGGTGDEALPKALVAVVALGRRSMSGYVGQSVILLILTMPYTLDLAAGRGAAFMLALALGT
ncbi:DUF418 domain-containing protein [Corynebacterium atypicum]|uniref:DUF418 domain-containing protein n=1 Tax=Corynebacterium atypicum TaxID=191610 RepID=UPI0009FC3C3D|nr:DUF418 domain-containing protein [Corynebacterium atypicum]